MPVINKELSRENLLALIKSGMEQKRLGMKALEDQAGVSRDSVRDFLRGKCYIPRGDKLQKILAVLYPGEEFLK